MKYSVNDFHRAFANEAVSTLDENRLQEQIAYDIVDMVNQIIAFDDSKSAVTATPLRDAKDAAFIVAQAAARLRVLLGPGRFVHLDRYKALQETNLALEEQISDLEAEIDELETEVSILRGEE